MTQKIITIGICFLIFSGLTTDVFAEDSDFKIKEGFFLGVSWVQNSIEGDFDDSLFFVSATHAYNVPDVDSGKGFGITMGFKSNVGILELGYQKVTHDTHTLFTDIGDQKAYYNVVDFNLKLDIAKGKIRPNILFGFGIPWLTIKNSKTDGFTYSDETFGGLAFNLGAGVAYFFNPSWCVNGVIMYRFQSFGSIEGISLDDNVSGSGLNYSLGIAYTF